MGRSKAVTVEQVEPVLHETHGKIALTADRLQVAYNTVAARIKESPRLRAIIAYYSERMVDKAELKFEQAIDSGQPWAIAMALRTKGKSRGYVERSEVSGPDGNPIQIVNVGENIDKL